MLSAIKTIIIQQEVTMQDNNNQKHIRNTLGILMASLSHEEVKFTEKLNGVNCSPLLSMLLYNRMLIRVLGSTQSYKHASIKMPKGVFGKLGNREDFKDWLFANERQTDMNSKDLLELGALSGWHSAWRSLVSIGLVRINEGNRVVLEYPIKEKFYSIEYAGNVMRGILKKKVEEKQPIKEEDTVQPDTSDMTDDSFWEE